MTPREQADERAALSGAGRGPTGSGSADLLHGVTLEQQLNELAAHRGWEEMGRRVPIRCFLFDPSVRSSLVFLRKTPWARAKVEEMYVSWKAGR